MNDFAVYLQQWHTFYAILVTAAATLMGLIFLAVSLRMDMFRRNAIREPGQIAWQTFINFVVVILIGLIVLIPWTSTLYFGVVLIVLGLVSAGIVIRRWVRSSKHLTVGRALVAFIPLIVCNVGLVLAAVYAALGYPGGVIALAPVGVALLGIAVYDAWDLVIAK